MAMFDYYRPAEAQACPDCGTRLREWQGKQGPNGLFIWNEGKAAPVDQLVADAERIAPAELAAQRLPATFVIYSYDCEEHSRIEAECSTTDGVWSKTRLVPKKR